MNLLEIADRAALLATPTKESGPILVNAGRRGVVNVRSGDGALIRLV